MLALLASSLAWTPTVAARSDELAMPWREAGWTADEAAAHLLSRFAYGARPGDVEAVAADPDAWIEAQLAAAEPEPALAARLARFRTLDLPVGEYARRYPNVGALVREAQEAGIVPPEVGPDELGEAERGALRGKVIDLARERGYRGLYELLGELVAQKILRAVHAENQLAEVMTDFWFNHFNVSLEDGLARPYVLAYERDAIRPHALGRFRQLLGATARHPAMLFYLDNARSTAGQGDRGLNENYARELLELHTLGVDGGYTQQDVVEVARAFTGWAALPPTADPERMAAMAARASGRPAARVGFLFEDAFLFRAGVHDAGDKTVLGHRLPAGRGIEDGEEVLDLLARHPATARHVARKIALRFVSDRPPEALVDRLASAFTASGGEVGVVLGVLVEAPEFWAAGTRAAKIKTPFELAISAIRALGAEVARARDLHEWIRRMGQPLYAYPVPSGFPDDSAQWIHAGALLNRMAFGLALAAGRVDGVLVDLDRLTGGREPESRAAALEALWVQLVPGRPLAAAAESLAEMVESRGLAGRLAAAAPAPPAPDPLPDDDPAPRRRRSRPRHGDAPEPDPLAQVVGVILGSPEFQRR